MPYITQTLCPNFLFYSIVIILYENSRYPAGSIGSRYLKTPSLILNMLQEQFLWVKFYVTAGTFFFSNWQSGRSIRVFLINTL